MVLNRLFEDYEVGHVYRSEGRTILPDEVRTVCRMTGQDQPFHMDEEACLKEFGRPDLLVMGTMLLTLADGFFGEEVSPADAFAPHYGYDKVRFIGNAFSGDTIFFEYKVKEKEIRDEKFGMLLFEVYVKNQDGKALVYMEDRLLVPRRETMKAK